MSLKSIEIRGKNIQTPAFLPDATNGYLRGVSISDADNAGIKGLVVNTYHLLQKNLIKEIDSVNGIHKYMKFKGLIISDSGGFQVMSLIRNDSKYGKITDNGAEFIMDGKKLLLTPENCVKLQLLIGSDIIMCLDDCSHPDISYEEQEKSVDRTITWAERCKKEFDRLTKDMKKDKKPLIFGIVQGGNHKELRKKCAENLVKIGFDGYAFGGFPVDETKVFLKEIVSYTASLMPSDKLKYAMGVGKPEDIVFCVNNGYDLFDCVIPTREARNNRLYSFKKNIFGKLKKLNENKNFYEYVRVRNQNNKEDNNPISKTCDCYSCNNFKKKEIYKLLKEKNPEGIRLTTIHNLRFYSMLMERLRE